MSDNRWFILGVLFIARLALGYQFQSAGSVAPFLIRDLGIDYVQVGLLVGGFILPGIAISLPSGFLGRRFGDKQVVVAGMVLMVLGGAITTLAGSFATMMAGRILGGIGGAILIVLMSKMVFDWFPDKERFLGNAIFIVGWPVGIAAAQLTQSRFAELHSWQAVFASAMVFVALALVLMAVFYHRPAAAAPDPEPDQPAGLTRVDVGMACLTGIIWMFLNGTYLVMLSFAPAHLIERGMSIVEAGAVVSLISWVCILALPVGGYLATQYHKPNLVMFGGLIASILLGAFIPFLPAPHLTFLLFGIAFALATPVVGSLAAEVLGPHVRGPGFGIYYLWYFGGMPVLLALGGLLRDWTGFATTSVLFAVGLLVCCLVLAVVFRLAQARGSKAESYQPS
jgi:MFS family permease